MTLHRQKSVREALVFVTYHPEWPTTPMADIECWEIICRNLFEIAIDSDSRVAGSVARSIKASKIILDRTVGTRRAGTHPAQRKQTEVTFEDMTTGELE